MLSVFFSFLFSFFSSYVFIYLKVRVTEIERERQREERSSRAPLDQVRVRGFTGVSRVGGGDPSTWAILHCLCRCISWVSSEPASRDRNWWPGGDVTNCATVLVLAVSAFAIFLPRLPPSPTHTFECRPWQSWGGQREGAKTPQASAVPSFLEVEYLPGRNACVAQGFAGDPLCSRCGSVALFTETACQLLVLVHFSWVGPQRHPVRSSVHQVITDLIQFLAQSCF